MTKIKLESVIPVSLIEAPVIVNRHGDVTFVFQYQGPEVFTSSAKRLLEINNVFESGLNFFDAGYVIHKQDVYLNAQYQSDIDDSDASFITKSYHNHFRNKNYQAANSYLYITRINGIALNRKYDLHREFSSSKSSGVVKDLDSFKESVFAFANHIRSCGAKLVAISADEDLYKLMDGYLSAYEDGVLSDLQFSKDCIKIGNNNRLGILAINNDENLPPTLLPYAINAAFSKGNDNALHGDFLNSVGYGLKADHVINTMMFLDGQKFWRQELEKTSKSLEKMAAFGKANTQMSQNNNEFLEATYGKDQQKVVRCHANIMFWSDDEATFKSIQADVKSRFIGLGVVPHIANYLDQKAIYLSSFPGNAGTMPAEETFVTHAPVATALFQKESIVDRSKGSPAENGLLYVDRLSNIPSYRDSWRKPYDTKAINSRNVLVVGESGGGKSSTIIELLRQYLELGFDITVIDIGRSFEIFAKAYNGNYIVYEEGMSLGINPFQIDDGVLTVDRLEYLASFIPVLWDPKREFSVENISTLENLILAYYKAEKKDSSYTIGIDGSRSDIKDFYRFLEQNKALVSEITKGKDEFFSIDSFLVAMEKFVSGKFESLFQTSQGAMIDPSRSLTCFELDNIKDHPVLFPIFSMLITQMSTEVLWKKRKSDKIFWFDEAWKVLEKPGMATLLKYLYKTVRKFDGAVGINIQTIGDLRSDFGNIEETILGNSPVKLIMKHKEELVSPLIKKLFGDDSYGDFARSLLRSINSDLSGRFPFTEHLNIIGDDMKVMRMMVSPYQRVNFMSEFKDKQTFFEFLNQTDGNMEMAFQKFVEFKKW